MSEISDAIQAKCLAFGDRIIKLNDYLLEQASRKYDGGAKRYDAKGGNKHQTSSISHHTSDLSQPSSISHHTSDLSQTSYLSHQPSRVPVHLQSVAALANQLLRSGTSIGAKQLLEQ